MNDDVSVTGNAFHLNVGINAFNANVYINIYVKWLPLFYRTFNPCEQAAHILLKL